VSSVATMPARESTPTRERSRAAMKDSGLPWVGRFPAHWSVRRGKALFKRMARPVRPHDEIVTAFRDGTVTLRRNRREDGFTNSILEIGYQGIRKGDLVIHVMDAFAGAIGVSDSDGKSTPVYSACVPLRDASPAYSDKQNARIEHDKALERVVTDLVMDHTELFKQFMENPSFKKWLADTIFTATYRASVPPTGSVPNL